MYLDPLMLSRLQFAWVIRFHILLPAFTVGLASYIALLEGTYLMTKHELYFRISTIWILAANSWMQIPAGYKIVGGRFFPISWLNIILNPSFPYLLAHNVVAFYITTAFVIIAVAAYLIRRNKSVDEAKVMFSPMSAIIKIMRYPYE